MENFEKLPGDLGQNKTDKIKSSSYFEAGEKIDEWTFAPGQYGIDIGFREIQPGSRDWFHGGNEQELRESKPLVIDTQSQDFQRVLNSFKVSVPDINRPVDFINKLNTVIQKTLISDMADERAGSLSEIIKRGRGACASKSLLAGLLTKKLFPATVQEIDGANSKITQKVHHPFGHAWIRVGYGGQIILYDPMYQKFQFFQKVGSTYDELSGGNFDFSEYSANAFPFHLVDATLKMKAWSGLMPVKSFDDKSVELFVEDEDNLLSQQRGAIYAQICTDGGTLKLYDGDILGGLKDGPKVRYPVKGVESF